MSTICINEKNRTIEITKSFAKVARMFGTTEYQELKTARNDFPGFKVITKSAGKKNGQFKGLTLKYMEAYIEKHDDEEKTIMTTFNTLRGLDENGAELDFAATASYGEIKAWFLKKYPVFKEYTEKLKEALSA